MAMMKTMMTVLVDVGKSMDNPLHAGGPKKITTATTLIASHMTQRIMASKTIEFSVVTYGSSATNNFLNSTDGGYEHVEEVVPMGTKTLANVGDVYNIAAGNDATSDIIDGFAVAQDILIRCNVGKKYNRVLLLITDGETEVDPDGIDHLNICVQKMRDDGFVLYTLVLGAQAQAQSQSQGPKSNIFTENMKLFQHMTSVVGTGGLKAVRHLGDGLCFLSSGPGLGPKPQQSKCQLNISPTLPAVPCALWNRVMKQTLPSLKKQSKRSFNPMDPGSGAVKRDVSHRNPDDPDEVIEMEHKLKGYKYGREYVPITAADEEMLRLPSVAGITVIGFLPISAVPRQYFMAGSVIMEPQPDNAVAASVFAALGQVLASTHQVGLVRVVKKDNAEPFLGCLLPVGGTTLVIQRLPFSEDIRDFAFPPLDVYRCGEKRTKLEPTVSALVDSMTYSRVTSNSIVTFNPVYQSMIHETQRKALFGGNSAASTSSMATSGEEKLAPVPDIVLVKTAAAAKPVIGQLLGLVAEQCSLQILEKREKKRKVYWDEIVIKPEGTGAGAGAAEGGDVSRSTSISSIDSEVANLKALVVDSQSGAQVVGARTESYKYRVLSRDNATNPAEAMRDLLVGNTAENILTSVDTLQGVIFDLILVGATGAHYKKAIQCIAVSINVLLRFAP